MAVNNGSALALGRSPHGERGLKLLAGVLRTQLRLSLSSRRAWIEIMVETTCTKSPRSVALLTESVD